MTTTHAERGSRGWLRLFGISLAGLATLLLVFAFATLSADAREAAARGAGQEVAWAFDVGAYLGPASRLADTGTSR